jgi:transcriptional regulator with XRE-family HTH domain
MDSKTLKKARKIRQLTQAQLAELMNVNQATVSRWETGAEIIPHHRLGELADLLQSKRGDFDPFVKLLLKGQKMSVVEDMDHRILFASDEFATAFHTSSSDLIGQKLEKILTSGPCGLVPEDHCDCLKSGIVSMALEKGPPHRTRHRFWHADQHVLHLESDQPIHITFMKPLPFEPPCR